MPTCIHCNNAFSGNGREVCDVCKMRKPKRKPISRAEELYLIKLSQQERAKELNEMIEKADKKMKQLMEEMHMEELLNVQNEEVKVISKTKEDKKQSY